MTDKQPDRAERQAFEASLNAIAKEIDASSDGCDFRPDGEEYSNGFTQVAWRVWQARASLAAQAPQQATPAQPDDFGSAEHWKEKAQYWAGVAHHLRGEALRGEPVDGIIQPPTTSPKAAQPAPSGDADRALFDAGWKACARFCDREDVSFDGIVGDTGCPEFEQAFAAARKEGK